MSKTSKVTRADYYSGHDWESHGKTFYVHEIEFENGDSGEYSSISQEQNKFVVGQEVEYELMPGKGDYAAKIKPVQSGGNFSSGGGGGYRGGSKTDPRTMILSYAKDMWCATVGIGGKPQTIETYYKALCGIIDMTPKPEAVKSPVNGNPNTAQPSSASADFTEQDPPPPDEADQLPF